jgi:hypothetical protein
MSKLFSVSNFHAKVWMIYCNPVHYDVFDSCPALARYAAENMKLEPDEILSTPWRYDADSFVVYQSAPFRSPLANATAQVKVSIPDYGAGVVKD